MPEAGISNFEENDTLVSGHSAYDILCLTKAGI